MITKEKVIKRIESQISVCKEIDSDWITLTVATGKKILELLKEQEEKPLRCKTCTMRDKTRFCHRWNREVKDDDYCSFGAWKGC